MALLRADTLTFTNRLLHPNRRYALDDIANVAPTADWTTAMVYDSQQKRAVLPFLRNTTATDWPSVTDMWMLDYAELDLADGQVYIPAGPLTAQLWIRGNRAIPTQATVEAFLITVDKDTVQHTGTYANASATVSLQLSQSTEVALNFGTVPRLVLQQNETLRLLLAITSVGGGVAGQHVIELLVGTETPEIGAPRSSSISLPGPMGISYERGLAGGLVASSLRQSMQIGLRRTLQVSLTSTLRRSMRLWRSLLTNATVAAVRGPRAINLAPRQAVVALRLAVLRNTSLLRSASLRVHVAVSKRVRKMLALGLALGAQLKRRLAAVRTFAAGLRTSTGLQRRLLGYRNAAASVAASVGGAINVPFDSLPFGQGVAKIVKKVIQVFDD